MDRILISIKTADVNNSVISFRPDEIVDGLYIYLFLCIKKQFFDTFENEKQEEKRCLSLNKLHFED